MKAKDIKKLIHTKSIVTGFLERVNISADMFERYNDIIIGMISGNHGIYALYNKNKLYYVGKAADFKHRIKTHTEDRHHGEWDQFSLYIIRKQDHIHELESLLIRAANPRGNRQQGKLKAAKNLRRELLRAIDQQYKQEKKLLLGSCRYINHRPKKPSTINDTDGKPLKGLFKKACVIYASYKGNSYKAWVFHKTGTIKFDGKLFDSPSLAGIAVTKKKTINGWKFWKYKNKDGELVYIDTLRN